MVLLIKYYFSYYYIFYYYEHDVLHDIFTWTQIDTSNL